MNYQPMIVVSRLTYLGDHGFKCDGNRQQGGSKGNDKNKDVMALVEVRLIEINTTSSTLMDMVDDMNKYIKELEYEGTWKSFGWRCKRR